MTLCCRPWFQAFCESWSVHLFSRSRPHRVHTLSWAAWPRSPGTSPLLALCALAFGVTYVVAAALTWRSSRHAPGAFVVAIGLLLFPARMIVPGGELLAPSLVVLALVAALCHRYLHKAHQTTA